MRDETTVERHNWMAGISSRDDVVMVELLYNNQWVQFDISALELAHLTPDVLWARYFAKALADIWAPTPDLDPSIGETHAPALSSSSDTHV